MNQDFNVEEGTYLAKDMYKAASNFTSRHGIGLEEEHAQHVYARYAESNWQMHQAAVLQQQEGNRQKRNIFGSIISTLTGLATEEQLQAEQLREKELEKKVTKMLSHEIEAEKQLLHLGEEFNELVSAEERRLKQLQWDNIHTNLYWSRKVHACCRDVSTGGGGGEGMSPFARLGGHGNMAALRGANWQDVDM